MLAKSVSVLILIFSVAGCTRGAPSNGPTPQPSRIALPSSSPVTLSFTATSSPVPTSAVTSTPTPERVRITAVKGNLFIRRGPDLAFNPLAVLMEGQTETALARDVLGDWVQIPLPGNSHMTGWVSIQTQYSAVTGDVMSLPEIQPTDWPVLASVRNCTFHQMVAEPGGIVIPALDNFPENDVTINPGIYRIFDTDVDGAPEVLKIDVKEGSAIDIRDDGDGDHRKCPAP